MVQESTSLSLKKFPHFNPWLSLSTIKCLSIIAISNGGGGLELNRLDVSVAQRVPFVFGKTDCYFDDKFQGIPMGGYTQLCQRMIEHPNIELLLNTHHKKIDTDNFEKIFYCGGIDEFFDYRFGHLQYRGVNFDFQSLEISNYQNNSVVNYPNNYDFTRITEYKHFLPSQSQKTIISMEYPMTYKDQNSEQCYPIPAQDQRELYEKYLQYSKIYPNLYFCGRLGTYQYLDMDDAIKEAMRLFEKIFKREI